MPRAVATPSTSTRFRAGQVIYLPIDGLTPEPDYPSFTAWFSEVAKKFAAGAFSVEDGDSIWLDHDD